MADEKNTEIQENNDASQKAATPAKDAGDKEPKKRLGVHYLQWTIFAGIVVICAASGFGLGRLFGWSGAGKTTELTQQTDSAGAQPANASKADLKNTWHYELEPVVANLNEPGATRYIRVALILQISNELDSKKSTPFIEERIPLLRNWLTIYLASLTIEQTRGDKNLMRIQSEILDSFNEKLFPDAKPQIVNVFFKDFAIQ
jgi:flagellar basal body-associated protein FliL